MKEASAVLSESEPSLLSPGFWSEAGADSALLSVHPKVFRDELARAAQWVADYLEQLPEQPVTRPVPNAHRRVLASGSLPDSGQGLDGLLDFVQESIAPYPTGNGHPAFFAWINSPPSPPGVIAELLACAINATCGMGEHALMDLERGVVRDLAALAGLPETVGGVLTSGGSMANLLCLATARQWFLQQHGATDGPVYDQAHARLVAYHSDQAHMSVAKAAAVIGLPPGDCAPCPPPTAAWTWPRCAPPSTATARPACSRSGRL